MFPVFELSCTDIERAATDRTKQHILQTYPELMQRIAHWRTAIATAARLMEQQRTVRCLKLLDDANRLWRNQHSINHALTVGSARGQQLRDRYCPREECFRRIPSPSGCS